METLTVKYWQKLFFGTGKDQSRPIKKMHSNACNEKDARKLHGKIIPYRRNGKPELL